MSDPTAQTQTPDGMRSPVGDPTLLEDESLALLACTIGGMIVQQTRTPELAPAQQAIAFLDTYADEFVAAVTSIQLHEALPTDVVIRVVHGLYHEGEPEPCEPCRVMLGLMRARVRRRGHPMAPRA